MSSKPDYSSEEWATLARAPFMVGLIVTLAAPSGITGVLEEGSAVTHALASGHTPTEPLLGGLLEDLEASQGELARPARPLHPAEAQEVAFATLRAVAEILGRKATPEEKRAFKTWLLGIAQTCAEAAKEGGVLGLGGVQVNASEKEALEQIRKALEV